MRLLIIKKMKLNLLEFTIPGLPSTKRQKKKNLSINLKKDKKHNYLSKGVNHLFRDKKLLILSKKRQNNQVWIWVAQENKVMILRKRSLLKICQINYVQRILSMSKQSEPRLRENTNKAICIFVAMKANNKETWTFAT